MKPAPETQQPPPNLEICSDLWPARFGTAWILDDEIQSDNLWWAITTHLLQHNKLESHMPAFTTKYSYKIKE